MKFTNTTDQFIVTKSGVVISKKWLENYFEGRNKYNMNRNDARRYANIDIRKEKLELENKVKKQ